MSIKLTNISSESRQLNKIDIGDNTLIYTFVFLPQVGIWLCDFIYKNQKVSGVKLSVGVFHLESYNFPFDFVVTDNNGFGIDPYKVDDFSSGRCDIYMLEPDELEEIRGYGVAV